MERIGVNILRLDKVSKGVCATVLEPRTSARGEWAALSMREQREDGAREQEAHRGRKAARRNQRQQDRSLPLRDFRVVLQGTHGFPAGRRADLKAD